MKRSIFACLIITYFFSSTLFAASTTPPNVLVSIPSFYALVSEVMQGVGKPQLLIKQGGSPHHYSLSPSEIKLISKADVIFWGGPDLEYFLEKPLSQTKSNQMIVELDKSPGIHWLNARTAPDLKSIPNTRDMHFWLDPDNAIALTKEITKQLSKRYPESRAQFEQNAKTLEKNIKAEDAKLKQALAPVRKKPYMVLHDGYQYFEAHYSLNDVGALTSHAEMPSSINLMNKVQQLIVDKQVECIFTEPEVHSKMVKSLVKDYHLKTAELESFERPNERGEYHYNDLLKGLSDSFLSCLGDS